MPTYSYRCPDCGDFDLIVSMHARPDRAPCPDCGTERVRRFTAPRLHTAGAALDRVVERAGRSAEAPQVVRSLPAGMPTPARPGAVIPASGRPDHLPALPRS